MKFLNNLRIRTELLLSFGIVIVLTIVVGIVGYVAMNNLDVLLDDAINRAYSGDSLVSLVERINKNVTLTSDMIIKGTPEDTQSIIQQMDANSKQVDTALNDLLARTGDANPTVNASISKLQNALNSYRGIRQEIINSCKANDYNSARDYIYSATMLDSLSDLETSVKELQAETVRLLYDLDNEAANVKSSSSTYIIAMLVVAVAFGLILAGIISGSIAKTATKVLLSVQKVAKGDFTESVDVQSKSELGQIADATNKMIEDLRSVLKKVHDASSLLDDASCQVSSSSMSLAQISTEQASSSEEISASITEIATQIKTNAENAILASELSGNVQNSAVSGNERMKDMLTAMTSISEASNSISNIIKVIDDIAFQTNILALNAAVEAARAGQHGKGFAVVAEEVRSLAARSAQAASETTHMIEGSSNEVIRGMEIAKETANALNEIVDGISKSAVLISNISSASSEQSIGVNQINSGMNQISHAIQTTSSVAEEVASSSSELTNQAGILKQLVSQFKYEKGSPPSARSATTTSATAMSASAMSASAMPASATSASATSATKQNAGGTQSSFGTGGISGGSAQFYGKQSVGDANMRTTASGRSRMQLQESTQTQVRTQARAQAPTQTQTQAARTAGARGQSQAQPQAARTATSAWGPSQAQQTKQQQPASQQSIRQQQQSTVTPKVSSPQQQPLSPPPPPPTMSSTQQYPQSGVSKVPMIDLDSNDFGKY